MKIHKIHFVFDKNKKSQSLKKHISKTYKNYNARRASFIVIAGGDGFMLKNIKKLYKFKKPFYGINCGTFGFLMNKYSYMDINKKISIAKKITINPLTIKTIYKKSRIKKLIAINELSLFRQSRQTVKLKLKINNKTIIKRLIGDGLLVSTPAGSTAYNLSVNGPILSLNSGKLAVTPISPFRPRRWRGKIISDKSIIKIYNQNSQKRPVAAVADNIEIRNVDKIIVKIQNKISIHLMYDRDRTLIKRIKNEQLRKK
tara:strand:- start:1733 stop:2503 length:771 start_codon:yes stop_codon:yes gene_type:complete